MKDNVAELERPLETAARPASSTAAGSAQTASPPPVPRKRPWVLALAAALFVAALVWEIPRYLHSRAYESTDDAFIEGHVTQISPQVSAHVARVVVKDNQEVKRGDLLVELDARDFDVQRAQAAAKLAAARGRLQQAAAQQAVAQANVGQAQADLVFAEANAENAGADLARNQSLSQTHVISNQELDSITAKAKTSSAQVESARKKVVSMQAQIGAADAQVVAAKADVEEGEVEVRQAELQLSYTKLLAPENGRVTRKSLEVGDYVQPGQALFALVQPEVWVVGNFKETQLAQMRPGQPVEIKVDTYPGRIFNGHVDSIQSGTGSRFSALPPENATGNYIKVVQRVPVRIALDSVPAGCVLGPGMSVEPTVGVR